MVEFRRYFRSWGERGVLQCSKGPKGVMRNVEWRQVLKQIQYLGKYH